MTIQKAKNLKHHVLALMIAVGVLLASPVMARDRAKENPASQDEPAGEIEEIIVTGTLPSSGALTRPAQ